jgi:transcriptional regulator GlxA family with amidase domain
LERLAHAFRVSPRTLLRRFGTEFAESPLTYLRRIRIDASKHLLVTTELSISAITERIGYEDTSTFIRMFSNRVGHTPARYRQRFKEF